MQSLVLWSTLLYENYFMTFRKITFSIGRYKTDTIRREHDFLLSWVIFALYEYKPNFRITQHAVLSDVIQYLFY